MRIPVVAKIVEGEKVAFPLPGCTDIVVRLCSAYRRLELAYTIDAKEDNVIVARVEGDRIPLGTYALEVRGKIFGNDWRSNEYEQVAIVDRNADADTELGETDEGENSVEMDTAVVVLPPSAELSGLISEAENQHKAMTELNATITTNETARQTAEEKREKAEEQRVKAEEQRVKNEQARITAETKRESDMAQAVEKANTASDIAVSANEPFVWMPFADLEHWNITAMDLTTGTVTLDTEEHNLAVGDSVTIAVNICDYSGPYSSSKPNGRGVSWDTAMGTDRLKNFPVKKFSSIPEMQVTAVNGAEITIDALKTDKNYTPTPKDWQLQRLPKTSESRSVEIPERYKGKAVTITVEGQYTNRRNTWSNYGVRTLVCDDKGNAIFDGMGDDQCGLPFVKQIWSGRSGHQEFVDIGTTFYNEGLTAGGDHKVSCFVDKPGDWDITLGKYLVMPWRLTHYATRVTVTPYHSLLLGGG